MQLRKDSREADVELLRTCDEKILERGILVKL